MKKAAREMSRVPAVHHGNKPNLIECVETGERKTAREFATQIAIACGLSFISCEQQLSRALKLNRPWRGFTFRRIK
jgi:hypothetical protein